MSSILRIANLEKHYQITNTTRSDVLKGIDLEMDCGEFVGIVGESGCGKSTLLHILAGLDTDYTGSVVIKGKFIRDYTESEMDDYRKKKIGMIFQNYNLISHMTLKENVEIAMEMSDIDKETREKRALELLKMVGLDSHADKFPNQLSGGQKQKVAIARSLANNPSIILADEPTGALDKDSTEQVIEILKKIAEMGKLVIVVTHSMAVADNATRIIKMDDGKVISDEVKAPKAKNKYEKYQEVNPRSIKAKDLAKLSFRNIWGNKGRSILVSIGIAIGIASMILILALSKGLTNYVNTYYDSDTDTVLTVTSSSGTVSSTKISSIQNIKGVKNVYKGYFINSVTYTHGDDSGSVGSLFDYGDVLTPDADYGTTPTSDTDILISLPFAKAVSEDGVIGAVGMEITLTTSSGNDFTYTVCGIYDSDSTSAYLTVNALSNMGYTYSRVYVKALNISYIDAVEDSLSDLNLSYSISEDSGVSVLDYIDLGTNILTAVACVSMVVSAIMIIIVMYISVIERTREIGILRSIGSRKKDISRMFIMESSMLGISGGILAVLAALLLASITNIVTYAMMHSLFISYNPLYYFIGFALSVVISALAGIAPSKKAAGLDPVEALRYE